MSFLIFPIPGKSGVSSSGTSCCSVDTTESAHWMTAERGLRSSCEVLSIKLVFGEDASKHDDKGC